MLKEGRLDDREVDIDVTEKRPPMIELYRVREWKKWEII
ncbi:MAG: hypothetical protein CM1200mP16_15770 [Nitrospina sp.]|nr:MAG: hypothetical protein CM1200mP16_15770 [Nitrospina sp.]